MNRHAALSLSGALLLLAFFATASSLVGMKITFSPPWHNFSPGELMFWTTSCLLLLPGCVALGVGLSPLLTRIAAAREQLDAPQNLYKLTLLVFAASLVIATLGHHLVLRGFPITDDENSARLGGQILASGHLALPLPSAWEAFPKLFTYTPPAAPLYSAMDWPGALLWWAIAQVTALDAAIFHIFAALAPAALTLALGRLLSPAWGLLAGLIATLSPMSLTLSWTTHAHLASRGLIAATLCALVLAISSQHRRVWVAAGLFAGLAIFTRPFESILLLAPLLAWSLVPAEAPMLRPQRILWLGVGAMLPIFAFITYNLQVTGTLLPPRFAQGALSIAQGHHRPAFAFLSDPPLLWSRFANNTAYNSMSLSLWFLTPLALPLVWLGARQHALARASAVSLILSLAISLLHDDYGLHMVGPIHYSEALVPLTLLTVFGARELSLHLSSTVSGQVFGASCLTLSFFVSSFVSWHAIHLESQAEIHDAIYSYFEDEPLYSNSVILVPQYAAVWNSVPEFAATGSFVFQWRPVSPSRDEPVIFLHHIPQLVPQLISQFPQRTFFVMVPQKQPPHFAAVPLEQYNAQRIQPPASR